MYSRLIRHRRKKTCRINKTRGYVKYTFVDAGWLEVSDLGKLHVMFSRKNREPRTLGLVTDDPKLSARQMIQTYEDRWSIEVFSRTANRYWGWINIRMSPTRPQLHTCIWCASLMPS